MTQEESEPTFRPVDAVRRIEATEVDGPQTPVRYRLDGNVGSLPSATFVDSLERPTGESIRAYPDSSDLVETICERFDLPEERVLPTAGSDGAIIRACRAMLEPGRSIVIPKPTFSLFSRSATLAGAEVRNVEWLRGSYPVDEMLQQVDERTSLIVAATPNNPTGLAISPAAMERIVGQTPGVVTLIDHAYVEYADRDFTSFAVSRDDVIVTRTLSKAWGMAGLRLGFAVAAPEIVEVLDVVGNPYPISSASIRIATRRLETNASEIERHVETVVEERGRLMDLLEQYGLEPTGSEANFVYARFEQPEWIWEAFAGMGFAVRGFPEERGPSDALRITLPSDESAFRELIRAARTIYEPEALLLDLDGVLADVSGSYRQAIVQTASHFGVELTDTDVSRAKAAGEANNDWRLTQRILAEEGVEVGFDEVKRVYEDLFQGRGDHPGLWREERLIESVERVEQLGRELPIGIVTGRPRRDAERFFENTGLGRVVETTVCMEDAAQKPEPDPVELLAERLGVERAWMLGDTPDDARAARAARTVSVLPLGVIAPGEEERAMRSALLEAGCARVVDGLDELEALLEATRRT